MSEQIRFFVEGIPRPQGSKITGVTKAGTRFMREANRETKPWRLWVAEAARRAFEGRPRIETPCQVHVTCYFPIPKKPKFKRPTSCGDSDKLFRAIADALSKDAGIMSNDNLIYWQSCTKSWCFDGQRPGAWISVMFGGAQ